MVSQTETDSTEKLKSHIPALLSLWRGSSKKSPLNPGELKSVSASLLELQRGLTGERNLAGAGYMEKNSHLGAYLLYYWPVTYMQISSAASLCVDLKKLCRGKKSISILDVGSGPGPASFALCDFILGLRDEKSGEGKSLPALDVTLVDSSKKALSLAEKIFRLESPSVKISAVETDLQKDFPRLSPDAKFDIIVMSHALNELWKNQKDCISKRSELLIRLGELMGEDGMLFLSEPALLETSRNLISVRDTLIQNGFSVISPCLKNAPCPALLAGENHTCHSEIKWNPCEPVASIARNAKLDRESVKASFFIFGKGAPEKSACEPCDLRFRVVSDAMLNKSGRVRFLICDGERRIPLSAKKDDAYAASLGFFSLHRYDSIVLENPELRGDKNNPAYGIKEDTRIFI